MHRGWKEGTEVDVERRIMRGRSEEERKEGGRRTRQGQGEEGQRKAVGKSKREPNTPWVKFHLNLINFIQFKVSKAPENLRGTIFGNFFLLLRLRLQMATESGGRKESWKALGC